MSSTSLTRHDPDKFVLVPESLVVPLLSHRDLKTVLLHERHFHFGIPTEVLREINAAKRGPAKGPVGCEDGLLGGGNPILSPVPFNPDIRGAARFGSV